METIVLCFCLLLSAYCLLLSAHPTPPFAPTRPSSEPHMLFRHAFRALVAFFG